MADKTIFREIIRQERAVELAFENHRWYDLRRWYIAHEKEYKELYALEFDQGHTYFNKVLYQTKTFEMKHYWLPFRNVTSEHLILDFIKILGGNLIYLFNNLYK